jgi:hypothetical protein
MVERPGLRFFNAFMCFVFEEAWIAVSMVSIGIFII